jgi:hypothetical protein
MLKGLQMYFALLLVLLYLTISYHQKEICHLTELVAAKIVIVILFFGREKTVVSLKENFAILAGLSLRKVF